jgi:spermidine/putrescine transport system ATP-binding protein
MMQTDSPAMQLPGVQLPAIQLKDIRKLYGNVVAVDGVSLEIEDGEFFSMLGPSGCGKTTTLRVIAGFATLDAGEVILGGVAATHIPPHRRDVNTVFQQYALFPHMTVRDNVGFGLRVRKTGRAETRKAVADALAMVRLHDCEERKPSELSGGQQQRVALARALVNQPSVLLLDEPLAALDLKLRQEMRDELKRLQREVGITFVYVTHDQDEAMALSDRIAVMRDGRIEQVGSGHDVYERPASRFVADFIGATNFLEVEVLALTADAASGEVGGMRVEARPGPGVAVGDRALLTFRPERAGLTRAKDGARPPLGLPGTIRGRTYLGANVEYRVNVTPADDLTVVAPSHSEAASLQPGDAVTVAWSAEDAWMLRE